MFGCTCFVSNNRKDNLEKWDAKSDEAIFLGFSSTSKAYRIFNKRTLVVEESVHIVFNEIDDSSNRKDENLDDVASKILDKTKDLTLDDTEIENPDEI